VRVPKYLRHKIKYARVILNGREIHLGLYGSPESRRPTSGLFPSGSSPAVKPSEPNVWRPSSGIRRRMETTARSPLPSWQYDISNLLVVII